MGRAADAGLIALGRGDPAPDRAEVGGKAWGLARLAEAGLPIPPTWVVGISQFRQAIGAAGLSRLLQTVAREPDKAEELRASILAMDLPPSLSRDLQDVGRRLGPRLAVRSSGVDEDGARRSFAGQHDSFLGVRPADLPDAVRACWASPFSERAIAYRRSGPGPSGLAVLLQAVVDADCSGVLFTINPLTGSWREMVVEAVWGLGEGLVSGALPPHWFLIRRPRQLPRGLRRLADRVRLQVVEEDLPDQIEQFTLTDAGAARAPTPAALRTRRTLDRPALRRLCRMGLKAERALGEPLDVEWVRGRDGEFVLLQARPITATGSPRAEEVLWTRRFVGERWPEPATPLGWSILAPVLDYFVGYPETQAKLLGGGPPLALHHGRPYVNATVFRHLAFKLPGSPPPRFMLELVPPEEDRAWRRRFAVAPDFAVYASILRTTFEERRWQRFHWNPFTNHLAWDRFQARLQEELPALAAPPTDEAGALALVETYEALVRDYVGIHICSLLFANLFWQLLEGALATWLPERRLERMESLATCPPGNLTVETNAALHALAAAATDEDLEALRTGRPLSGGFEARLRPFLERFGHRSEASWEILSPRWQRAPARLVPLLVAQRATEEPHAPLEHARLQEERHERAMAELRQALTGPQLTTAELLVHYTRRYLLLRENQRFWFDRLLFGLQGVLLWLGERARARGALDAADNVAFLTRTELFGLFRGTVNAAALPPRVTERRAQRDRDLEVEPPTFLLGDGLVEPEAASGRLQGTAISPGRARGIVRVLHSVADGPRLQRGEILVARSVDPGWTPLFLQAGAVVLELGSVLSHGAVVAREYGVPAVVNIEGATRRLVDGQTVTVDGSRGVVWVHR